MGSEPVRTAKAIVCISRANNYQLLVSGLRTGDLIHLSPAAGVVEIHATTPTSGIPELTRVTVNGERFGQQVLTLPTDGQYRVLRAERIAELPCLTCGEATRYRYDAARETPATSVVCEECDTRITSQIAELRGSDREIGEPSGGDHVTL